MSYPIPELLRLTRGGSWQIRRETKKPRCDFDNHILHVPLDESPRSRAIRAHELGHAQWSPRRSPHDLANEAGVPHFVLQCLEDARINSNLRRSGVKVASSMRPEQDIISALLAICVYAEDEDYALGCLAALLVATIGCEDDYAVAKKLILDLDYSEAVTIAEKVRAVLEHRSGFIPYRDLVSAAQFMLDTVVEESTTVSGGSIDVDAAAGGGEAREATEEDRERAEQAEKEREERLNETREKGRRKLIAKFGKFPKSKKPDFQDPIRLLATAPEDEVLTPRWGSLIIDTPPLTRRYHADLGKKRRKIHSDHGLDLLHVERAYDDGLVFRTKSPHRQAGGSILVDCSGSMAMTNADLRAIVKALPASVVALYGGYDRDGLLRIIAKRGSMVDAKSLTQPGSGANVVDGPCLEWLCQQPPPRYWYSDGYVTGVDETHCRELIDEAQSIVDKGSIRRVTKVEQILKQQPGTPKVPYSYLDRAYTGFHEAHDTDQ